MDFTVSSERCARVPRGMHLSLLTVKCMPSPWCSFFSYPGMLSRREQEVPVRWTPTTEGKLSGSLCTLKWGRQGLQAHCMMNLFFIFGTSLCPPLQCLRICILGEGLGLRSACTQLGPAGECSGLCGGACQAQDQEGQGATQPRGGQQP